jgi:formamidase
MATKTNSPRQIANECIEKMAAGSETVFVNEFTDGLLDPARSMLGPVSDGGHIVANTAPGCWGPMITPAIRGGHEVTRPVAVAGAEVGDAIAIRINRPNRQREEYLG